MRKCISYFIGLVLAILVVIAAILLHNHLRYPLSENCVIAKMEHKGATLHIEADRFRSFYIMTIDGRINYAYVRSAFFNRYRLAMRAVYHLASEEPLIFTLMEADGNSPFPSSGGASQVVRAIILTAILYNLIFIALNKRKRGYPPWTNIM